MEPLGTEPEHVFQRARLRDVSEIIIPSFDQATWPQVKALSQLPGVHTAYGIHPWVSDEIIDEPLLIELLNSAVAVGEIGLDFKIPDLDKPTQLAMFERQLNIARQIELPVILHCRGAFNELLELVAFAPLPSGGVVHAYSRGPELAQQLVNGGLHIAFGGAITRPGAKQARRSAQTVPMDKIVLETDSPAIGLHGIPTGESEPHHTMDVAIALADLRNMDLPEVIRITTDNAKRLFKLS
jgi:TatD DNase family protein